MKTKHFFLFFYLLLANSIFATNYYVSNTGSDSRTAQEAQNPLTPWATIQMAANNVPGGSTVIISGGTYSEVITINSTCNGTAGNPTVFKNKTGETVIVDGGKTNPNSPVVRFVYQIKLNNVQYITLQGLTVQNVNWYGIEVRGSNNIVIDGCKTFMSGASGIYANTCSFVEATNNDVQKACQVTTRDASGNGTQECITFAAVNNFKISNNKVSNSTVSDAAGGEGIDVKGGSSYGEISNNYVHDILPLGIYVDAGSFGSGLPCFNGALPAMQEIRIFGNIVERTNGLAVAGELGGHAKDIYFYNNIIKESSKIGFVFNIPGSDLVCGAATIPKSQVGKFTNIYIVNNVFYNNTLADITSNTQNPANSNIVIKNNIFYSKDIFNTTYVRTFRFDSLAPFTVTNNMYYDFKSSAQSITLTGADINLQNPLFTNTALNDYSIQTASPAINSAVQIYLPGTSTPMFTTDISGAWRGASNWDMGVSEVIDGTNTVSVTGITLNPTSLQINQGETSQLIATITPSNANNQNVTWSSSNTSIASVSSSGLVTASATNVGLVTITATTQDGNITATANINVIIPVAVPISSISVNPSSVSLFLGQTAQLTPTISPSNASNQTVNWISSNTSIATVSSTGLVSASSTNTGTVTISVVTQEGNFTANCILNVLQTNPNLVTNPTFDVNTTGWSTSVSSGAVATIASTTIAGYTVKALQATITNAGTSASSIQVRQLVPVVAGKKYAISFKASALANRTIGIWLQQNVSPFTIWYTNTINLTTSPTSFGPYVFNCNTSDSSNLLKFLLGNNLNSVYLDDVSIIEINIPVSGISVNPTNISINQGQTTQLTATVLPSNATNQNVVWSTSNSSVATVTTTGLVTASATNSGFVTITATSQDGSYTASSTLNVTIPVISILVTPTTVTLNEGQTAQLSVVLSPSNATNQNVIWSTNDASIATVSATGLVTASSINSGVVSITATSQDGNYTAVTTATVVIPVASISVSPTTLSVNQGQTTQLTATIAPSNATNQNVIWSTNDANIATVSATGLVTASSISSGVVTITATSQDGSFTATTTITVVIPVVGILVSPTTVSVNQGQTTQITATITPSNATNQNVIWSTNDANIATVSATGLVTASSTNAGVVSITATSEDGGYIATSTVTVVIPVVNVTEISVSPTVVSVNQGQTMQLTATITPSNATNQNVIWSTNDANIATVSATGLVTASATNAGIVTITATSQNGNFTATSTVTVVNPVVNVTGILVSPTTVSVNQGQTTQLTATITPSNATNQNVIWSTNNSSIATVSATGLVTASSINSGGVTITATSQDGGFIATTTVTVVIPIVNVTGISVSPTIVSINRGQTAQLTATISPSNATNKNVIWNTNNSSIATVSATGLVTASATNAGIVTITATSQNGSFIATSSITVINTSTNIVTNPTFNTNTANWAVSVSNGALAGILSTKFSTYSGKALKATITNQGTSLSSIQIRQPLAISSGRTYTITFKASGVANRPMAIAFQQDTAPYNTWFSNTVNLTTTPTTFGPFTFNCSTSDPTNFIKFLLGNSLIGVYIDDVVIRESANSIQARFNNSNVVVNGIDDDNISEISVFPNPVVNSLNVEVYSYNELDFTNISLYNIQGVQVYSNRFKSLSEGKNSLSVDLGFLTDGMYIAKINTSNHSKTIKILKRH